VGCRVRSAKSDLLRIVVAGDGTVTSTVARVVPDPRGRLPGRGAHLHPALACLALAERRRAIGRALRLTGEVDVTPVRDWVNAQETARQAAARQDDSTPVPERADDHDERSMSQHR
jgi:predicted RNA-binding protein YlxR (DUF448 family)